MTDVCTYFKISNKRQKCNVCFCRQFHFLYLEACHVKKNRYDTAEMVLRGWVCIRKVWKFGQKRFSRWGKKLLCFECLSPVFAKHTLPNFVPMLSKFIVEIQHNLNVYNNQKHHVFVSSFEDRVENLPFCTGHVVNLQRSYKCLSVETYVTIVITNNEPQCKIIYLINCLPYLVVWPQLKYGGLDQLPSLEFFKT